MHKIQITIKTLSPVIITSSSGDPNLIRTYKYIPGSVLLGLYAYEYIKILKSNNSQFADTPHKDQDFYNWFIKGRLTFSNAYISKNDEVFKPSPLCLHRKKIPDGRVYNLMIENSEQTTYVGGFCSIKSDNIILYSPHTSINFHNSRYKNRLKGHSEDKDIFNYESVNNGEVFIGEISGSKEDLEKFKQRVKNVKTGRIGRSKQTQYGHIELELGEISPLISDEMLEIIEDQLDSEMVYLFLTSPAILQNEQGFPDCSSENIERIFNENLGAGFKLKKQFAKVENIENYVGIWRMKRPIDKGLVQGSIFSFEVKSDETTKDRLISLLKNSIGERTNEGFGKLELFDCSKNIYILSELSKIKKLKPNNQPPKIVQQIFNSILDQYACEWIINEAVKEALSYSLPNSNSLIGRLERILKDTLEIGSIEDFKNKIKDLRDTAKKNIQRVEDKKRGYSLYEHIINYNSISPDFSDLDELKTMLDYKVNQKEWDKLYMLNLFRKLRGRIRKEARNK